MDYRECLRNSRITGKALNFPFTEHCKEYLTEQLKDRLKNKMDGEFADENNHSKDMLWIIKRHEKIENGIYSWNRPEVDLAIVAPPSLMALVMGEFALAAKLSEEDTWWQYTVEELYMNEEQAGIGGGCYSFGEACLLSSDMSVRDKIYFWKKNCYAGPLMTGIEYHLLMNMQFHNQEKIQEDIWRPIQEVRNLRGIIGSKKDLLGLVVKYALRLELDGNYENFWDMLYQMFPTKEEHMVIIEAVHDWFYCLCSANNLLPRHEERLLKGIKVHVLYERTVPMNEAVTAYLMERIPMKTYMEGKRRKYLEHYFNTVQQFDGEISKLWQEGMLFLLENYDHENIECCFKNGFLKKEYLEDYIEILLQEHFSQSKIYSRKIARLIQMKWKVLEGAK